jgi:SOS-response transcriptional repressor LexA
MHLVVNSELTESNEVKANTPRIIPFESVKPYVNAVPIYDIKVAASNFTDPQFYEEFCWVELPMQVSPKKGYFIAQVIGESMNKKIPNGSYCLFEEYSAGSRNGEIVLAECTSIQDGDYGSGYTIKEYSSSKSFSEDSFRHEYIVLKPVSYDDSFENIVLSEDEIIKFTVKGIFKKVLNWI